MGSTNERVRERVSKEVHYDTNIFELDVPKLSKLSNCIVSYFGWYEELHQAHLFRA